jgi:Transposase DDE domain
LGRNTAINKIRWRIEQTIANLKTWRILHTDYRRPLATFADTISAVIGLQFYRTAWISLIVVRLLLTVPIAVIR